MRNDVVETIPAGGNLPIELGFLRASLMASTAAMPPTKDTKPERGVTYAYSPAEVNTVISNAKLGDTIYFGFTANYARRMEYGFNGVDSLGRYYEQRGFGFVRKGAMNWQDIVARNARRLAQRSAFSKLPRED